MQRFVVTFIPADLAEDLARQHGWSEDSNTSWWDHIEPDQCEREFLMPNKGLAIATAKRVFPDDLNGEVHIARERSVEHCDHIGPWTEWETTHTGWMHDPNETVTLDPIDY